ncbi:MAG: hypothetical protein ACRC9X_04605, partial [Bacteroidales bacterium]
MKKILIPCLALAGLFSCTPKVYYPLLHTTPVVAPSEKVAEAVTETKDDVSISMKIIDIAEQQKSAYYTDIQYVLDGAKYLNPAKVNITPYDNLMVFEVTIKNNTEHILRLKNSRAVFISSTTQEPLPAFTRATLQAASMDKITESIRKQIARKHILTLFPKIEFKTEHLQTQIKSVIDALPIYSDSDEVFPGMSIKRHIAFNVEPESFTDGRIIFVDIPTATDEAGNVTRKTSINFSKLSLQTLYTRSVHLNGAYQPFEVVSYDEYLQT